MSTLVLSRGAFKRSCLAEKNARGIQTAAAPWIINYLRQAPFFIVTLSRLITLHSLCL